MKTSVDTKIDQNRRAWIVGAAIIAAVMAVYLILAVRHLGRQDLDFDELTTSTVLRLPWGDMIGNRLANGHPPLYFMLAWGWVRLAGHTMPAMILLSVLVGGIGVALMPAVAREMGLARRWGALAALLLALHPTALYLDRFARPYAGVITLTVAALWLVLWALRRPGWGVYGGLAAVGLAGAAWNHILIFVWIAVVAAVGAIPELRRRARPGWWGAAAVAIAAHVAMLIVCSRFASGAKPLEWVDETGGDRVFWIFVRLLGGKNLAYESHAWAWLIPPVFAAAPLIVAGLLARRGRGNPADPAIGFDRARWQFILAAIFIPLALVAIVSWTAQPLFVDRYLVFVLPAVVLCLVRVLAAIPSRRAAGAAVAAIVGLLAAGCLLSIENRPFGLRACVGALERRYDPVRGDGVMIFSGMAVEAMRLYSDREYRTFVVPRRIDRPEQWRMFEEGVRPYRRFWVLAWRFKGGIMSDPDWAARAGRWIETKSAMTCKLIGYERTAPPGEGARALSRPAMQASSGAGGIESQ